MQDVSNVVPFNSGREKLKLPADLYAMEVEERDKFYRYIDLVLTPSPMEARQRSWMQWAPMARHDRIQQHWIDQICYRRTYATNKPYPFLDDVPPQWLTGDVVAMLAISANVVEGYHGMSVAASIILGEHSLKPGEGWIDTNATLQRLYRHSAFGRFVRMAREKAPPFTYEMTPQESGLDEVERAYARAQAAKTVKDHIALMQLWRTLKADYEKRWGLA